MFNDEQNVQGSDTTKFHSIPEADKINLAAKLIDFAAPVINDNKEENDPYSEEWSESVDKLIFKDARKKLRMRRIKLQNPNRQW